MKIRKTDQPKPRCRHLHIIAVETLGVLEDSDRVAFLCLDCDAGLPHDFASPAQ